MCNWVVNCTARDDPAHKPNSKSFAMRDGVAVVERVSEEMGGVRREDNASKLCSASKWYGNRSCAKSEEKVGKKEGKEKQRQRNVER